MTQDPTAIEVILVSILTLAFLAGAAMFLVCTGLLREKKGKKK